VVPDALDDLGPLGGVLAGLDHAAAAGHRAIVTAASDSPFLPEDLVERLQAPRRPMAIAEADGRLHPVFGLWPVALRERLRADLGAGTRRVADWALAHGAARVAFPAPDAFFNVNTAEDLARAEAML